MGTSLGVERDPLHDRADLLQRLKVTAIMKPRVARSDPANPIWLHLVIQKPDARVHPRLARPEDGVGAARSHSRRQIVDWDHPGAPGRIERGSVSGRDRCLAEPRLRKASRAFDSKLTISRNMLGGEPGARAVPIEARKATFDATSVRGWAD